MQRLEDRADEDAAFRALLLDVADALVEIAGPELFGDDAVSDDTVSGDTAPGDAEPHVAAEPDLHEAEPTAEAPPAAPATVWPATPQVHAFVPFATTPDDLLGAAERARDKAKPDRIAAAHPNATDEQRRLLSNAYATLADAAALVAEPDLDSDSLQPAIERAAEAQSALRAAFLAASGLDARSTEPTAATEEPEGYTVFQWLREATRRYGIFVQRYMRWQDPADPARAPSLSREIRHLARKAGHDLAEPVQTDPWARPLKAVLDRADRIERGDGARDTNWDRLLTDLAKAVRAGLAESAVGLRAALLPILDTWPDDAEAPPEAARVRRALEQYVASRPEEEPDDEGETFSDEVAQVAGLLRGQTVACFGGVAKPHVVERIERAFGVTVHWQETRAHQSTEPFRAAVSQPGVGLAVLFIRWCSHSFEDLKAYCDDAGVPYVRVKAGNHPNRLAHAILAQVGDRLRAAASA